MNNMEVRFLGRFGFKTSPYGTLKPSTPDGAITTHGLKTLAEETATKFNVRISYRYTTGNQIVSLTPVVAPKGKILQATAQDRLGYGAMETYGASVEQMAQADAHIKSFFKQNKISFKTLTPRFTKPDAPSQ